MSTSSAVELQRQIQELKPKSSVVPTQKQFPVVLVLAIVLGVFFTATIVLREFKKKHPKPIKQKVDPVSKDKTEQCCDYVSQRNPNIIFVDSANIKPRATPSGKYNYDFLRIMQSKADGGAPLFRTDRRR